MAAGVDPHGWLGFWSLYRRLEWEPETFDWLASVLAPGDFFVDVGAWIGPVSIWAHSLGATVLAIEPDVVAYEELIRRVPEDSTVYGAIGTRRGIRRLLPNPEEGGAYGDSMSRLATTRADNHGGVIVGVDTLPGLLAHRPKPAAVKIDVEGYEVTLMRSLGPWLAERRIPLQVSCHGVLPSAECFRGYAEVDWPASPSGDVRCWP